MKELIIVGAGGFGREAYYIAKAINTVQKKWIIKGFIDDDLHALDGVKCGINIIGKISNWEPNENEEFAMGIASAAAKKICSHTLEDKGAHFINLIHPLALFNEDATIGRGCVISARSSVGAGTVVGNFVHIAGSMIGQDAVIGDYSTTTGYANLTNAYIGEGVFIGSHAVILNKRKVGDYAYVCAGSIVMSNIKAGTKVFGNPAKRIDTNF